MAPRKKKTDTTTASVDLAPEAVGKTLADYAERVVKVLSKLGYNPVEVFTPGQQEWAKLYYESDGATMHRVTLVLTTDIAGLSPVKIENVIVTTQRALPPDAERWVAASGSAKPVVSPATVAFKEAGSGLVTSRAPSATAIIAEAPVVDPYSGPYARDVAFLLRALDLETRSSVIDVLTCSTCKQATDSWIVGNLGAILCPSCA